MPRVRLADTATGDLFEVPQAAAPLPASMDYRPLVSGLIADMLDDASKAGKDRYAVAAEASRLAGREVSKNMLDAYTSQAREEYNAPAWLLPVLETVCQSYRYSTWLAGVRGGRLLVGRDALAAELGRLERQRDEIAEKSKRIRDQLRRGA